MLAYIKEHPYTSDGGRPTSLQISWTLILIAIARECLAMEHLGIISPFKLHVNCTMYRFLSFHYILNSDHSYYLAVINKLANFALYSWSYRRRQRRPLCVSLTPTVPDCVDVALSKCQLLIHYYRRIATTFYVGRVLFLIWYDGLTDLLEIYEKVCNIDRQLLKAEMKTFKADATVLNIMNPEHTPIMSGELQSYPNLQTVMRLALT